MYTHIHTHTYMLSLAAMYLRPVAPAALKDSPPALARDGREPACICIYLSLKHICRSLSLYIYISFSLSLYIYIYIYIYVPRHR